MGQFLPRGKCGCWSQIRIPAMIPAVFLVSLLVPAPPVLGLQCWSCTSSCKERKFVYPSIEKKYKYNISEARCVEDSGCKWTQEEKVTCAAGVNHCLKMDNLNGTVTRSCAYWSVPVDTFQDVMVMPLRAQCFRYSMDHYVDLFDRASRVGLKKHENVWQCPCDGDLCNEGDRVGAGAAGMLLAITISFIQLFG